MKTSAFTIRLDPDLERQLDKMAVATGRSRSDLVRDALRRQLALLQFEQLRRRVVPFAEARGYLTDEAVFRDVSCGAALTPTCCCTPSLPGASARMGSRWSLQGLT